MRFKKWAVSEYDCESGREAREEGRQDDKNGEGQTDRQKVRYKMKKLEIAERTTENE